VIFSAEIRSQRYNAIRLEDVDPVQIFGVNNNKLNLLKTAFPKIKVVSRGDKIKLSGKEEEIHMFKAKVDQMKKFVSRYGEISNQNIESLLDDIESSELSQDKFSDDILVHGPSGIKVRARTPNQQKLVDLTDKNDVVFAVGPAGTGKTYTAVALAVRALKNKSVKKIVLTRPAVEAGENLGFLPGDLKDKIDPYLRPLYDALDHMIPIDKLNYYMVNRVIEIAPLAFMRGRTLDNAFIILDEAQNSTNLQLKMFLTRLGPSAKCIITGDLTQIDLPRNQKSGLAKSLDLLKNIRGIGMVFLSKEDVIRHRLVKHIIQAYESDHEKEQKLEKQREEKRRLKRQEEREERNGRKNS